MRYEKPLEVIREELLELRLQKKSYKRSEMSRCFQYRAQGLYISRLVGMTIGPDGKRVTLKQVCEACQMCYKTLREVRSGVQRTIYFYHIVINYLFMVRLSKGCNAKDEQYLFAQYLVCVVVDCLRIFKGIFVLRELEHPHK